MEILATAILYPGAIPNFENLIENILLIYAGQILCKNKQILNLDFLRNCINFS